MVAVVVVVKGPKFVPSHPRNRIASARKENSWGKIRHGLHHRGFGIVVVAALEVVVVDDEAHVEVRVVAVVPVHIADVAAAAAVVVVAVPVIEEDVQERYTVPFGNSIIESSPHLPFHMPSIPLEGATTEQ